MRYFIEVTEAEAMGHEANGTAKVAQGASGGNGFGSIVKAHQPWLLMRSTALPAPVADPSGDTEGGQA